MLDLSKTLPAKRSAGAPSSGPARAFEASFALVNVDTSGRVIFADPKFCALLGMGDGDDPAGRAFRDVAPGTALPGAGPVPAGFASTLTDADGREHSVAWTFTGPNGFVGLIATDASADARSTFTLDELTGLPNRAALLPAFGAMLERGSMPDTAHVAACLDLDRFKRVNDSLGHAAGDELLRKVAKRLSGSIRPSDVVLRMGGDEFTILFANCKAELVESLATRIIDVISRSFVVHGHQVSVGTSVGLAILKPGETDVADLLRRADVALYQSKNTGRGRFSWFEEGMLAALNERRLLETELRKALLLDQFELAYQAQFDFGTDSVSGFEALIRWRHPVRGLVSPAAFIPIAEETREILKIGAWVLEEACRMAMTWPAGITVAVNVSPVQFEAEGFVESVRAALTASGLPPTRLELELTESVLLTNDDLVIERMHALRGLGVRLSLDDFGTGYSSLNYLRKYPFNKVKIDQSFVREPFADENAHHIVTAVAGLGASMGMTVIAEGVETEEQLDRIRGQGCSAAQGYLLSRPIPAADIATYLAASSTRER